MNIQGTAQQPLPAGTRSDGVVDNPFSHSTILIIDDEPLNVRLLEKLLQRAGYQRLILATDARESLNLYREHQPDLVLLDISMPGLDGFGVMQALREEYVAEEINVVMVTAHDGKAMRRRALEVGVRDFINKPIDGTEVLTRIHNLLHTHHLTRRLKVQNEDLASANAALEDLNDSMSELVSIVSHELRTPLTSIKSFAEILRDEDGKLDADSKRHFLTIIDEESDRLSRLISDLLDLQKIQSGKMNWRTELVDLHAILSSSIEFFGPAFADKGLSLTLDSPLTSARVLADADKLRQVLSNLLSNALKFTASGGVQVHLECANPWAQLVLISDDRDSGAVLTDIVTRLGARLDCFRSAEQGLAYLDRCGGRVDLLIVDIGCAANNDIELMTRIRNHFPSLPVTNLIGGYCPSNPHTNKAALCKPLDAEQDRGHVEALINDLVGLTPGLPMLEISIRDSGTGIPVEQLNKVFDRFHQVDSSQTREHRGTGLGLTICQQIVQHYQGKLWVESQHGEGSTFHLLLPEMREEKKRLGEILVEKGLLTAGQLTEALRDQV